MNRKNIKPDSKILKEIKEAISEPNFSSMMREETNKMFSEPDFAIKMKEETNKMISGKGAVSPIFEEVEKMFSEPNFVTMIKEETDKMISESNFAVMMREETNKMFSGPNFENKIFGGADKILFDANFASSMLEKTHSILKFLEEFDFIEEKTKKEVDDGKKDGWYFSSTYYNKFKNEVVLTRALEKEENFILFVKDIKDNLKKIDSKYVKQFEDSLQIYNMGCYYSAVMVLFPTIDNIHAKWIQKIPFNEEYKYNSKIKPMTFKNIDFLKSEEKNMRIDLKKSFLKNYLEGYAFFFENSNSEKEPLKRNFIHHGSCDPDSITKEDYFKLLNLVSSVDLLTFFSPIGNTKI